MPHSKIRDRRAASRSYADFFMTTGLLAVVLFFVISGIISYSNTKFMNAGTKEVTHTHDVIIGLEEIMSTMKDAETGQRGFILTGNEAYLEPYNKALAEIESQIDAVSNLTIDNATQQKHLPLLRSYVKNKLAELSETVELRRDKGFEAAQAVMVTDRGRNDMDSLRGKIADMRAEEVRLRDERIDQMKESYRQSLASDVMTAILGVLLSTAVGYLIRRTILARRRESWMQAGQTGLNIAMSGDQRVEELGDNILKFMAEYFDAHAGVFYTQAATGFRRIATYGVPEDGQTPEHFEDGEGLLGQAAKDGRAFYVRDVPEGYLSVGSALGKAKPRYLAIAPSIVDGNVNAVFELGFIHALNDNAISLMQIVAESIGVAVRSANYRAHLQNLLEETQRQSEELQTQSEELRVSNEELEEQSNALKASQFSLQQQQAELEQSNSQLEEQTQLLEAQRDDIARAKATVQNKAQELEQASQYKSDFLANMSHELRTPLNSSLILAKLLADNKEGNLTAEQVKFAETIQGAGNDLLTLINDILDLSKIEAGHMDVHPAPVQLSVIVSNLDRLFRPIIQQKGLVFETLIKTDCPDFIETDRQRLEQVLKNLMSNAIKFTEKGSVKLVISRGAAGQLVFAVADTGIGISPEHQRAVFDAFRQADGTISRKYGGTGLGLSISRELARLLGGSIELLSEPGKGSTFSIVIPEVYNVDNVRPHMESLTQALQNRPDKPVDIAKPEARAVISHVPDDRDKLVQNNRVILVIEDDESFARILYDIAHENGFQCLIATTAEDGWVVARQYLPSAVLLDVGLPDHSGLSVLDRLKHDPRTRHIPVHVVSSDDYTQTAMSLGAVGYMIKPVKREDLAEAFKKIETRLDKHLRRVLVVEDDMVQRDSMCKLLASHEVEVTAVGTAAECLERLKETTYDCMVLDLSLPDASGYSLLEKLSQEDSYSFPPVIVYTGRDLSTDDEHRLRRYSKSIIIKGAKSPERLLDEVTLFLHQVESELPLEQQRMLEKARHRDSMLEGRRILLVEDDIRNVYAVTNIFEPHGVSVQIARNGLEALQALKKSQEAGGNDIDLVLMDVMMPEMDGITATREIRKMNEWKKLPIIMLTAKAMRDDQERCLAAGASDYMAKPLDVEKLVSLVRVWMPR